MEALPDRKGQDRFIGTPLAQVLGIILALFLGIMFMLTGLYEMFCLPMLIGIAMYVIPKVLGVKNTKVLLAAGVVYLVAISCVGGLIVSPALVDANSDIGLIDQDDFSNASITSLGGGFYDVEVEYTGTGTEVNFYYGDVSILYFYEAGTASAKKIAMSEISGIYTAQNVNLGDSELRYFRFKAMNGSDVVNSTNDVFHTGTMSDSDLKIFALEGNLYFVGVNLMFVYFLVIIFSYISRKSLDNTRERMEREGRLYPQGYGRCKECGSLVLPGETCCRKCGAFIEVPDIITSAPAEEDMECSECGAPVRADATECPRCGASFDSDDGTGTSASSDELMECSECGAVVSADATECPNCGEKFESDDDS